MRWERSLPLGRAAVLQSRPGRYRPVFRSGLNQYTSVGGTSYSYDENGNLTNDGTYRYYYDCENRLTDVNDQSDQAVASYKYDYQGRRVKKTVYGSPDVITKYCYDGDQVIAEYDGSNTLLRKFMYGPGIDEPICMFKYVAPTGIYYYHFDGLGSVAALSNNVGSIVERYSYDVFGEPNTTSCVGNPYMFTARRYDDESDLYYYRARYYESYIGRFLQTDPISYVDSMNLYTYIGNNSINGRDPRGLSPYTYGKCKTMYDKRRSKCLKGFVPCIIGCGVSPGAGVGLGACITGCAISGPFIKVCLAACLGVEGLVIGGCAITCGLEAYYCGRSAKRSYDYCMCRAEGCDVGECLHHLE